MNLAREKVLMTEPRPNSKRYRLQSMDVDGDGNCR